MKVKILTIALAILAGTFASCSKQDDDINNISAGGAGVSSQRMEAIKIGGIYTIESFHMNRLEHAAELKGVRFLFADNNVLYVMESGGGRYKGAWGADYENRQMKMHVVTNDRIEMLNGGYNIVSIDRERVILQGANHDESKKVVFRKKIFRPRVLSR